MKTRTCLLLLLCLVNLLVCRSQDITFKQLTTKDGLSHYSVMALYQDERGFIWIGTRNGVNVYNGNNIKIYKQQKDDPTSLLGNSVTHITGDRQGKVYIHTIRGISCFDMRREVFTTLLQGVVDGIYYDKKLYISRGNVVYVYNGKIFEPYYTLPGGDGKITCLQVQNDSLLLGTEGNGLYVLNEKKKQLTHPIKEGKITHIFRSRTGEYWIGSWDNGLFVMSEDGVANYRNKPGESNSLSSDFVRTFCQDDKGSVWVGTFNGLDKFDKETHSFSHYLNVDKNDKGLNRASVWGLLCDNQGTVWAGSYFGGVTYFNPGSEIYHQYRASDEEKKGFSSPVIGKMIEDKDHNLWICTEGGGLNVYNRKTRRFRWYKHSGAPNSISHNNIKSIYYDAVNEIMWIGTHLGGLNKLDLKTGRFFRYLHDENNQESLPSNIVGDIIPYRDRLLLATHDGVCMFNPQTGKFNRLFKNNPEGDNINFALSLFIDHRGTLWIAGSENGAYSYNFDTRKLTLYRHNHALKNSISSNGVNCIFEDSRNRLWFCTAETGLDLYRYDTDDFENFDAQANGLFSNCVYGVCEMSPDRLLAITDNGFSCLDWDTKQFRNFNANNGLPLAAVNQNAVYKAQDGEIFVGGVDGMVSFYEKDLDLVSRSYRIFPYRLIVNGKEVATGDDTGILKENLTYSRKITLKAGQSMFSIVYAVPDYGAFDKDEIIYKLEGFSDAWTTMSGEYRVTYTNLSPGKYTLIAKANTQGGTVIPESRLEIEILPPFYCTVWAYILYVLVAGGILYFLVRMYNNRIKLQESLKYERKHIQDVENLSQSKLRFFTNISHEFRTPLTLIIGQMEMLLQVRSFAPSVYNKILGIYKSCLQLQDLITELLDFRKQEQGHMKIKVSEHNIVDFLYENYLLFQEYAVTRQIKFRFNKINDVILVWYDAKQLQKVFNNLLSNAFKHTRPGGEISLTVRRGNREVIIEVIDNGEGIATKDIDKIFNRFYQAENLESTGTGIGLALTKGLVELHHGTIEVESEPHERTAFTVRLKLGKEHFDAEQICMEGNPAHLPFTADRQGLEIIREQEMMNEELVKKDKASRVLIVEDNDSLREMLVRIFEPYYFVMSAANGKEALEKVGEEAPDIILSDVVMPEVSGTELCKKIKSDIETCHIPVVLLTARTTVEHNLEGLRMGADDYITKPFNINILLSRCNNLVNNRIVLQEKFSKQPKLTPQLLATNPLDKEFVDKAMQVMEKHLDDINFNVDVFAREMNIARTKLFVKLKAVTGQTPYDFISTVRLKKAAVMLKENPELNISEISERLGFSSPRHFSKCFKDKYHIVPLAYRKGLGPEEEEGAREEK